MQGLRGLKLIETTFDEGKKKNMWHTLNKGKRLFLQLVPRDVHEFNFVCYPEIMQLLANFKQCFKSMWGYPQRESTTTK